MDDAKACGLHAIDWSRYLIVTSVEPLRLLLLRDALVLFANAKYSPPENTQPHITIVHPPVSRASFGVIYAIMLA
jgi:hypothetical protein